MHKYISEPSIVFKKLLQPAVQFRTKLTRSSPISYNKTIPTYPGLEFN